MTDTANPNPDWYPDPTGRFEQRYWDGSQWTEHVSSAGQQRSDPLPGGPTEPEATADRPGLGEAAPAAQPTSTIEPDPVVDPAPQSSSPSTSGATGPVVSPPVEPEPVATPEPAVDVAPAPDWYADPTGRYEQRYWDGSQWSEHVTAAGQQGVDPLPDESVGNGSAEPEVTEPEPAEPEAEVNPFAAGAVEPDAGGSTESPEPTMGAVPGIEPPTETPETTMGPVPGIEPPTGTPQPTDSSTGGAPGGVVQPDEGPSGAAGFADVGAGPAPDWYPDPTGRYEQRYWDGAQWTEHANSGGQQVVDPIG